MPLFPSLGVRRHGPNMERRGENGGIIYEKWFHVKGNPAL